MSRILNVPRLLRLRANQPPPPIPATHRHKEAAPAPARYGPPEIPRKRVCHPGADIGAGAKAVTAVVLGAGAVGALVAPQAAHADTPDPVRGLAETHRALADTIPTARTDAWSAFVRDSVDTVVEHEAVGDAAMIELAAIMLADSSADLSALPLGGSVGSGGVNSEADVTRVQERLAELGFPIGVDGESGGETRRNIRLFEAILTGAEDVSTLSGKIEPGSVLHRALLSPSAPKWEKIPASGTGFVNGDTDHHSYASDRMVSVIKDAGTRYSASHLASNEDDCPITTNDASKRKGGNTADHETHEGGLDLDLRLPRKDGTSGTKTTWSSYDRDAAYEMVKAFAEDSRVERILIGDTVMLQNIADSDVAWKDKVVNGGSGHKDHIHIDISPATISGVTAISA